jgi:hypothetical protein
MANFSHDLQKYYETYYIDGNAPGVCTYLKVGENGGEMNEHYAPCHASAYPGPITWNTKEQITQIHECIWHSDDSTKDYVEWICGPNGPFKEVIDQEKGIYRNNKGHIIGVSFHDLNQNSYLLVMNFLFASRVHSEHRKHHRWKLYLKAREKGFDQAQSIVISHMFGQEGKILVQGDYLQGWHSFLAYHDAKPISTRRLREGDYVGPKVKYTEAKGRQHNPPGGLLNYMWNDSTKVNIFNLKWGFAERPQYNGAFSKALQNTSDLKNNFTTKSTQYTLDALWEQREAWSD